MNFPASFVILVTALSVLAIVISFETARGKELKPMTIVLPPFVTVVILSLIKAGQ